MPGNIVAWGPAGFYEVNLYAGTPGSNYVSLPAIPYRPDPEYVFRAKADCPPINIGGNLTRQDSRTGDLIPYIWCAGDFGKCLLGDGFWLASTLDNTIMGYWGKLAPGDQLISLPGSRRIGNPLDHDVLWSDCWFTDGATTKTPAQAAADGWVLKTAQRWDVTAQSLVSVDITASGTPFLCKTGYTVSLGSGKSNLALIVPNP